MSNVKRYEFVYTNDFGDEYPAFERIEVDGEYVKFEAYNAAQSELAALREELADLKSSVSTWRIAYDRRTEECENLKERLSGAEQRNATLTALLREVSESLWQEDDSGDLFERIDAALAQPTGSGASE